MVGISLIREHNGNVTLRLVDEDQDVVKTFSDDDDLLHLSEMIPRFIEALPKERAIRNARAGSRLAQAFGHPAWPGVE